MSLLRFDAIGPTAGSEEAVAVVWADLLGQARVNARTAIRYLVFMAVAGVIASFGVIDQDQILIVGAMAVAPDLLPITATCTGLVLRRPHLIRRGLVSLLVGLGVACIFAAAVTGFLNLFDLLPVEFDIHRSGSRPSSMSARRRSLSHSRRAWPGCSRSRRGRAWASVSRSR